MAIRMKGEFLMDEEYPEESKKESLVTGVALSLAGGGRVTNEHIKTTLEVLNQIQWEILKHE